MMEATMDHKVETGSSQQKELNINEYVEPYKDLAVGQLPQEWQSEPYIIPNTGHVFFGLSAAGKPGSRKLWSRVVYDTESLEPKEIRILAAETYQKVVLIEPAQAFVAQAVPKDPNTFEYKKFRENVPIGGRDIVQPGGEELEVPTSEIPEISTALMNLTAYGNK